MNLNENLLRSFAKAINTTTDKETKLYYGTITEINTDDGVKVPYVHLDGSEAESKTPLIEGAEVLVGDRVIVTIENHKAVVISNITSPASARTAKSFMDLLEDGLVVGMMNEQHSGSFKNVLIGSLFNEATGIDEHGVFIRYGAYVLAKFVANQIVLGQHNEIVIQSSKDQETIETFSSTTFTLGHELNRIISIKGDTCFDTESESYVYDVDITSADYTIDGNTITINSPLDGTTIEPQTITVEYSFYGNIGGTISIGTNSLIKDEYPLVIGNNNLNKSPGNVFRVNWAGQVYGASGCNARVVYRDVTVTNIAVPSGESIRESASVNVPSGYIPCGLLAYRIDKHQNTCCFVEVDVNTNGSINFRIQNHGSSDWRDVGAFFQVACIWTG